MRAGSWLEGLRTYLMDLERWAVCHDNGIYLFVGDCSACLLDEKRPIFNSLFALKMIRFFLGVWGILSWGRMNARYAALRMKAIGLVGW